MRRLGERQLKHYRRVQACMEDMLMRGGGDTTVFKGLSEERSFLESELRTTAEFLRRESAREQEHAAEAERYKRADEDRQCCRRCKRPRRM